MTAFRDPEVLTWIYALGWTLLHVLWQGALVGAAYAFARWLVGPSRAQWRYGLGLGALATLAVLPVLTFLRLLPAMRDSLASSSTTTALAPMTVSADGGVAAVAAPTTLALEPWLPWIVALWSLGVAVFSLRTVWEYWRLRTLVQREARPLPEWDARLRELARRFGVSRPVRLVQSAIVRTPSLIGWIAPVILLPSSVLVGLSPQQIELVLAHELGHIRRWDYAVNLLQIALEAVLFYHPVVHWISREVRNDREACCDDLVLRLGADPMDYASTLASLEELRGMTHAPVLAASGGVLVGRIRRIVGVEAHFPTPLTGGQSVLVLALALAVLMAAQPITRGVFGGLLESESAATSVISERTPTLANAAAVSVEKLWSAMRAPVASPRPADIAPPPAPVVEPARLEAPRIAFKLETAAPALVAPALAAADLPTSLMPTTLPEAPVLDAPAGLKAVRTAPPAYPRRAAIEGLEGSVTLSFAIDGSGRARDIEVIGATEPGVFEAAAITALREWRFSADVDSDRRYSQSFEFTLAQRGKPVADECLTPLGTRICRRSTNELGVSSRVIIEDPAERWRAAQMRPRGTG